MRLQTLPHQTSGDPWHVSMRESGPDSLLDVVEEMLL